MINLTRRWAPALLWMVAIFCFSSHSAPLGSLSSTNQRGLAGKIAHIVEYAVLTALVYRAVAGSEREDEPTPSSVFPFQRFSLSTFSLCLLYAISDELHQHLTPGRAFEFTDLGYDLAGILAMLSLIWIWKRWMESAGARGRGSRGAGEHGRGGDRYLATCMN